MPRQRSAPRSKCSGSFGGATSGTSKNQCSTCTGAHGAAGSLAASSVSLHQLLGPRALASPPWAFPAPGLPPATAADLPEAASAPGTRPIVPYRSLPSSPPIILLNPNRKRFAEVGACPYPSEPKPTNLAGVTWLDTCDADDWSGQRWLSRAAPAKMAGKANGQYTVPTDGGLFHLSCIRFFAFSIRLPWFCLGFALVLTWFCSTGCAQLGYGRCWALLSSVSLFHLAAVCGDGTPCMDGLLNSTRPESIPPNSSNRSRNCSLEPSAATSLWEAVAADEFNPCSWPFVECDASCQPNSNSNTIRGL